MSVTISRAGDVATVTIVSNIADIRNAAGVSAAEKKLRALQRADEELRAAIEADQLTNAQLDQRAADVASQVAALKAARPTGNL